jgi:PEGA domain-containing protein
MNKGLPAWMVTLILGTSPLAADPVSAEIVLARGLFSEARAAEDAKDWALAASKLRDAIAIKETGGLRFHLAYCEEQQGLLVEALVDYERSDDLTAGANEEFRAQLPAKRESLRRRIPTITLLVPPKPGNATLTVDGHPMPAAALGKPIPLNPGRHTLVVSAPDHAAFTTQVSLNETEAVVANALLTPLPKRVVVSTLKPSPAPVVPPSQPLPDVATSTGIHARTYVLIAEAAVALGAIGVGIGYTLRAASEDEHAEQLKQHLGNSGCNGHPENAALCADLQGATNAGKNDHLVARIGFIAAGAAAATFVGTLILWRPAAKVAIIPSFAPGAAELSVGTHF